MKAFDKVGVLQRSWLCGGVGLCKKVNQVPKSLWFCEWVESERKEQFIDVFSQL